MATSATDIFCDHPEDHDVDMKLLMDEHRCPLCCQKYEFTKTPQESKALNDIKEPLIIIAASGMATGGRIVHHLKHRLPSAKTTVMLVGFQAFGTRGRMLQDGVENLRIYGKVVKINAKIETLHGLSAHADQGELLRWLQGFESPPKRTFIVHGEKEASETLADILTDDWGWSASVAQDSATLNLADLVSNQPTT
jgi:metallo-beta-lactamase family protein